MKKETMRFPDGTIRVKVSTELYQKAEEVRNFILKDKVYEEGQAKWIAIGLAMSKFDVTRGFCDRAIKQFPKWYYGLGLCHRPIEDYIERDKVKRQEAYDNLRKDKPDDLSGNVLT